PGPGLRAVLRPRRRRPRRPAAHPARADHLQPDDAAGVLPARAVVDPGAARDRQHGHAGGGAQLRAGAAGLAPAACPRVGAAEAATSRAILAARASRLPPLLQLRAMPLLPTP